MTDATSWPDRSQGAILGAAHVTDERLRQLEQTWKATGDRAAEVALLIERVRVGELDSHRLRLAAFLGHDAAARAARAMGLAERAEADAEYGRWLFVIGEWGLPFGVRAAIAVGREATRRANIQEPRVSKLVDALVAWTDEPSLERFVDVKRAHDSCSGEPSWQPQPTREAWAAGCVITAARAVIENSVFWASSAANLEWSWPGPEELEVRRSILRGLVRDELLRWVLRSMRETSRPASPIQQRVRTGALSGDRALLAAYVGVPEAVAALGASAPHDEPDSKLWFLGLMDWSDQVVLRAVSAVSEAAIARWDRAPELVKRAQRALRVLARSFWSGRAMAAALPHLRPLLEHARASDEPERCRLLVFQHALTVPWFIDPFRREEDDERIGVLTTWSGTVSVELGGEVFLRIQGDDGEPVWRVDFDGERNLTKHEVMTRVLGRLVEAAVAAGMDAEAIKVCVREEVGSWALTAPPDVDFA